MGVRKETMSNLGPWIDGHKALQDAVIPEGCALLNDHVRSDRWAEPDLGAGRDHRGGMNTSRRAFGRHKKLQRMSEGQVRIQGAEEWPIWELVLGSNDDGRGARLQGLPMILGVGQKSEFGFRSFLQPGDSRDFEAFWPFEFAFET